MNSCPRGKFRRLIFSEEAKYALKFGYTVKIEYCYQFKRGKDLFKNFVSDHYKIKQSSKDPLQKAIAKLLLNSLYGRMGMKNIVSVMKIVTQKEAEALDKNKTIDYTKEQLRKSGLNKTVSVPSAVHIASAISSYARMIINDYKNITGNPCIMSDTDSAVLPKPLPRYLVGKEIGQMKLEHIIELGIFIRKKLYYIKNSNNLEIIKASGVNSSHLNYNLFLNLLKGETITIERTNFNVEWKEFNVNVVTSNIIIQGLTQEIKTIYNTQDVNFKYISFPKKYNIIIHPLHPMTNNQVDSNKVYENKNKINNTKLSTLEQFVIFIFLFSFLSLFALFLYKIY